MTFSLSVIVPNLNDAKFLPTALDALLVQSEPAREIVVVDDGSSDDSRSIIENYASRFASIRPVFLAEIQGVVAIMNRFVREAAGEFIYFAAADDFVLPGYFASARRLLEKCPEAGLCSALCRAVDEAGNDTGVFPSPLPRTSETGYIDPERGRELLLRHDSWVMGNTAIYRRKAVLAEGGFRPEFHGFSDGFMHRLMILEHGVCFIPKPYVCLRRREGSVSDRTNTDLDILSQVIAAADGRMRNDRKGRFSETYIDRWRRRTLFGALRLRLFRQAAKVGDLSLFGLNRLDRYIVRKLIGLRAQPLAELYPFLRMRWFDLGSMLTRRLQHAWRRSANGQRSGAVGDRMVGMKVLHYAKRISTVHPVVWSLMWRFVWEIQFLLPHDKSYHALVHLTRKPDGLFLDVGANNGISALSFRRLNKTYKILSLEPDPRHQTALHRVRSRIRGFDYRLIAAGRKRAKQTFYTPCYKSVVLHTFTSADRSQAEAAVGESFGLRVGAEVKMQSATWLVVPIDELGLKPDIIKIDVEGLDTDVLLGADETIKRARPFVMIEACHVSIAAFSAFCSRHRYAAFAYEIGQDSFRKIEGADGMSPTDSNNVFLIPRESESQIPVFMS